MNLNKPPATPVPSDGMPRGQKDPCDWPVIIGGAFLVLLTLVFIFVYGWFVGRWDYRQDKCVKWCGTRQNEMILDDYLACLESCEK